MTTAHRTTGVSARSRVRPADALGVGAAGLRARLLRSVLSALGEKIVRARHAASCDAFIALTVSPFTITSPRVGLSSPATRLRRVDFPEPEGPISAV